MISTQCKLLGIINDPQKLTNLKIELVATTDVGETSVKATYSLEGDDPLVLQCYEVFSSVKASVELAHYPNLNAVAQGLDCVQARLTYFNKCLSGPLKTSLDTFKVENSKTV